VQSVDGEPVYAGAINLTSSPYSCSIGIISFTSTYWWVRRNACTEQLFIRWAEANQLKIVRTRASHQETINWFCWSLVNRKTIVWWDIFSQSQTVRDWPYGNGTITWNGDQSNKFINALSLGTVNFSKVHSRLVNLPATSSTYSKQCQSFSFY
jgi:hypothetical protein